MEMRMRFWFPQMYRVMTELFENEMLFEYTNVSANLSGKCVRWCEPAPAYSPLNDWVAFYLS